MVLDVMRSILELGVLVGAVVFLVNWRKVGLEFMLARFFVMKPRVVQAVGLAVVGSSFFFVSAAIGSLTGDATLDSALYVVGLVFSLGAWIGLISVFLIRPSYPTLSVELPEVSGK